jgi:flagellar protein FliO/FliZ
VLLVDTDGQRFLLGVTEHGINVLHSSEAPAAEPVPGPVVIAQEAAPLSRRAARLAQTTTTGGSVFARELLKQLGRQP